MKQLAQKTGIHYTSLSKIENDVISELTIRTVATLAEGLGVTIDSLVYGGANDEFTKEGENK